MGDYTNSGVKIGTCGAAYYATLPMLQREAAKGDIESRHYVKPENRCTFAFPFPEWDKKAIGDISVFHSDQWIPFYFKFKGESFHRHITTYMHPEGCPGVNVFAACPQDRENEHRSCSVMEQWDTFRLYGQCYHEGTLHIVGECPFCKAHTIFDKNEAALIVDIIRSKKYDSEKNRLYALEIANRIESTYA